MNHDDEDVQAFKNELAYHKSEFADAKLKADREIPDYLVSPYGRDNGLARFNDKMSSDELFKLAKLIKEMAESKMFLEKHEFKMKKAGLAV